MFYPTYLYNISRCFMLTVIFFHEVLIFLHSCLDSTHTNCSTAMCMVFNFLYKNIVDPIVFIIHMLRLSNTFCRCFFL
jgi:hypothetical protein